MKYRKESINQYFKNVVITALLMTFELELEVILRILITYFSLKYYLIAVKNERTTETITSEINCCYLIFCCFCCYFLLFD